jgi:hypothetical protein
VLTLPSSVRVYLAAVPVDLRRGHDGLVATVCTLDRGVLPQTVAFRPGHELGSLVESRFSVEIGQSANFAGINRPVAQETAIPAPNAEAVGLGGSERSDALPRAASVA